MAFVSNQRRRKAASSKHGSNPLAQLEFTGLNGWVIGESKRDALPNEPYRIAPGGCGRLKPSHSPLVILLGVLLIVGYGCSHLKTGSVSDETAIQAALRQLQTKYAPIDHLGLYSVGVERSGNALVLTGKVDRAQAYSETIEAVRRITPKVQDKIKVLPEKELGDRIWGIGCLSVASGREQPEHKAEMGTQVSMGGVVRVLQRNTNALWFLVQTADGYPAWLEKGTFYRCTLDEVRAWTNSPLLIVTAFESLVLEQPQPDAQPVSDVVIADLLKKTGQEGTWYKVELPDHREGFLPMSAAEDFQRWQAQRKPTPANIERTARTFLGRPYLWGGNSPKGFDCSGFTKTVFYLNGIDLGRNASHQARQGVPIPLDGELSQLKAGDLLFFGRPDRGGRQQRIHHVAIYLGDKLFIHSSERVQINSLDPNSPIRDELRIRTLLGARRILEADRP